MAKNGLDISYALTGQHMRCKQLMVLIELHAFDTLTYTLLTRLTS